MDGNRVDLDDASEFADDGDVIRKPGRRRIARNDFSSIPQAERERSRFRRLLNRFGPWSLVLLLVSALSATYWYSFLLVVVRPGEAGVLYRLFEGGTVTDRVYGEGLHVLNPFNRMITYDTRIQTALHEFTVLTNKGLPITLRLAIRYHPEFEMVAVLHQRVGPDYVNTIVVPQIESVMRRNIGRQNPEDIYTNKEGILTDIVDAAIEETGQKFVFIESIVIREVILPDDVQQAIEDKLVFQQRFQAYEFRLEEERQEAERKRIEAAGERDYQATINETLTDRLVRWQGVRATLDLAQSPNSKVVVIGSGENGLPIILGSQDPGVTVPAPPLPAERASASPAAPEIPVEPVTMPAPPAGQP